MSFHIPPGTDLSKIPVGTPPPGEHVNLENPPTLQATTLGVTIPLISIGTCFATISILQHWKKWHATDYLLIVGLIISISYSALVFSYSDLQRHNWDFPLSEMMSPTFIKEQFAQTLLVSPATFAAKAAILALYLQLFRINRRLRMAIYFGLLLDLVQNLIAFIIAPALCVPRSGETWDVTVLLRCGKTQIWGIIYSVLAVILDIFIFVIPIPTVSKLHMSTRKKWAVTCVFGTAVLGIMASITSLVYRIKNWKDQHVDGQWYTSATQLCSLVELWIAIIVAGTPGFASKMKLIAEESRALSSIRIRLVSLVKGGRSKGSSFDHRTPPSTEDIHKRDQNGNRIVGPDNSYTRLAGSNDRIEMQRGEYAAKHPLPPNAITKVTTFYQNSEHQNSEKKVQEEV